MLVPVNIEEMIDKKIIFEDINGEHEGVIDEIRITKWGIFYRLDTNNNDYVCDKTYQKTWWLK